MDQALSVYLPIDRRHALATGTPLPEHMHGAALFADISGFTPLTEALTEALGPRRGAEALTHHLNLLYDALIREVEQYGGSVVGFAGDGMTCWFAGDSGLRAVASAFAMQGVMAKIAAIAIPGGSTVTLAMKTAIATGPVRRFVVGDPQIQLHDVLAGGTLDRMAAVERHAAKGEVLLDEPGAQQLGAQLQIAAWRGDEGTPGRAAVVEALTVSVAPTPWPPLPMALSTEQLRPWLLPVVYERLTGGHGELLTELRPAVALFLHFAGIDYDGDPEAGQKLNRYIEWTQNVVTRYGGTLLDITIGDKGSYLYVAFGAPITHEDDALRAVLAAWTLRVPPEALAFIQELQIGISRGTMRSGAYGGTTRRTYGVLGDEVNLAARLMQRAEAGQVLGSGHIQQATRQQVDWETLASVQLKGKREPIPLFRLKGLKAAASAGLAEPSYALPMVGREGELRLVEEKLRLALAGQGQLVGITAEAGMGKSRLVTEVIRLAHAQGFTAYGGACQSYGTDTPYLLWQPILRSLFGLTEEEGGAEGVARVERELQALNPALLPRLPLLGRVLNLPFPENALTRSLDPALRKTARESLVLECLQAWSTGPQGRPLLLVLEDCHWLDPLSHDLLEEVGRALATLPILLVMAYRPPALERLQSPRVMGLPHATEIHLAEFTPQEAGQLIRSKLAQAVGVEEGTPLSEELLAQVTQRAQGNPFYIEELLNFLQDQGLDARDSAVWQQVELPGSLHSLVLSRIDQLGERQKITLKVASIIGRLFRVAWLYGYYPALGETGQVKADLELLSRLELTPLESPEPELTYLFKHIVTQEVAYESLAYATRAVLHEQLAHFLEASAGAEVASFVDLLAYHFERSENLPKKREYLRRAGEAAQAAYANETAISYYERLLALLTEEAITEQVDVCLKLGEVQMVIGQWDKALERYHEALGAADMVGGGHRARSQAALGALLGKRGEGNEAIKWLEQALAAFEALGDRFEASRTEIGIGRLLWYRGDYEAATARLERTLVEARARGDRHNVAYALGYLGNLASSQADFERARLCYEEALPIRRELGEREGVNALVSNLALVAMEQSNFEVAQRWLEESLTSAREVGDKRGTAIFLNNLGAVFYLQEKGEQARSFWENSLLLHRQVGDKAGIANTLKNCGLAAHHQGEHAAAQAYYEEGLRLSRELEDKPITASILGGLGHLALEQGDPARAAPLYRESLTLAQLLGDKRRLIGALAGLAGVAVGSDGVRSARLAAAAEALMSANPMPIEPIVRTLLGRAVAAARAMLEEPTFVTAWAEGQAMLLEQALAYALEG